MFLTGVITTSDGLEPEVVNSYKYLGVRLGGTLSFSQHISKLQAKVKYRLGFLYRKSLLFHASCQTKPLIQMTNLPMLDYGDVIYRSAGKGGSRAARCSLPFGPQICHQNAP